MLIFLPHPFRSYCQFAKSVNSSNQVFIRNLSSVTVKVLGAVIGTLVLVLSTKLQGPMIKPCGAAQWAFGREANTVGGDFYRQFNSAARLIMEQNLEHYSSDLASSSTREYVQSLFLLSFS